MIKMEFGQAFHLPVKVSNSEMKYVYFKLKFIRYCILDPSVSI